MKNWFYSLYKFRIRYRIDKEAMVAYIDVNKPDEYIIGDDRSALDTLTAHFVAAGYCVLVED
jgi:hypothetical protein